MRKHLIKLQNIENPFEVAIYTTLTGLCLDMEWSHNWLKTLEFPFEYKGYFLDKMPLSECPAGHKWAGKNKLPSDTSGAD